MPHAADYKKLTEETSRPVKIREQTEVLIEPYD
jgi:hypothetical protein